MPAVLWGLLFRLIRALFGRPRRRGRGVVGAGTFVVACLGSSATDAAGSYDWINDLSQRPGNAGLRFYRFAEGGDLAYNGLARVPDIVGCRPDYAVVLLGGNDVLALVSAKHAQFVRMTKHLPKAPSPEWYRESMRAVVRRLKSDTHARIGLCSLTPIGEDPGSTDRFQAQVNLRVQQYSAIVKDIAQQEAVGYTPVYERIHELILASPGRAGPSQHSTSCRFIATCSASSFCTKATTRSGSSTAGSFTAMLFTSTAAVEKSSPTLSNSSSTRRTAWRPADSNFGRRLKKLPQPTAAGCGRRRPASRPLWARSAILMTRPGLPDSARRSPGRRRCHSRSASTP